MLNQKKVALGETSMALVKCPECGKEISDVAKACPNCGFILHKNGR